VLNISVVAELHLDFCARKAGIAYALARAVRGTISDPLTWGSKPHTKETNIRMTSNCKTRLVLVARVTEPTFSREIVERGRRSTHDDCVDPYKILCIKLNYPCAGQGTGKRSES
jgi:hypothetical protein